jgi:hypothetical protein
MSFKVGDEVVVTEKCIDQYFIGESGVVTAVDSKNDDLPYQVTFASGTHDWFGAEELKKA